MRLSRNKIEYLADRILALCHDTKGIYVQGNQDSVLRAIEDAIYADMHAEQEIDDEVDELLRQHQIAISAEEMDMGALRMKMKRELAKKRGFVL